MRTYNHTCKKIGDKYEISWMQDIHAKSNSGRKFHPAKIKRETSEERALKFCRKYNLSHMKMVEV